MVTGDFGEFGGLVPSLNMVPHLRQNLASGLRGLLQPEQVNSLICSGIVSGAGSGGLVDEVTRYPQCLQTFAAFLIVSAQSGQVVSSSARGMASSPHLAIVKASVAPEPSANFSVIEIAFPFME